MPKRFWSILFLAACAMPHCSGDVVFGRRVYATQGRTFQQIWSLDTRTRHIAPLTASARRHAQPVCTPDGKRIWFLSGAFGNDANSELWSFDRAAKTEKLALQFSGRIERLLGGGGNRAFFIGYEADQPGLYRWDGRLVKLSKLGGPAVDAVSLSPDASSLAVQTGDPETITMMSAAGVQGSKLERCAAPVWSHDGRRLACVTGNVVRIVDLTTGVELKRAEFLQRSTPPAVAGFSPDATRLLVKTVGANENSTNPQSDYWIFEIAAGKWTFAGPGQSALLVSANTVLLVTPRELTGVGKVRDWISQILAVDPATHAQTPVTTGASSNAEPCLCSQPSAPPAAKKSRRK